MVSRKRSRGEEWEMVIGEYLAFGLYGVWFCMLVIAGMRDPNTCWYQSDHTVTSHPTPGSVVRCP